MHPPIFVREPSAEERARLEAALRASDAFTVRRAQIVLLSAEGRRPREIARGLRCAVQTVRNGVRAFNAAGMGGPDGRLVAAQERGPGPRRGRAWAAACGPAPAAARLRPRPQRLDARAAGGGGAASPRRSVAGAAAARSALASALSDAGTRERGEEARPPALPRQAPVLLVGRGRVREEGRRAVAAAQRVLVRHGVEVGLVGDAA